MSVVAPHPEELPGLRTVREPQLIHGGDEETNTLLTIQRLKAEDVEHLAALEDEAAHVRHMLALQAQLEGLAQHIVEERQTWRRKRLRNS